MNIRFYALLISLISGAALNTQAKDIVDLKDFPKWFKKAMKREAELEKKSQIDIEKLKVKGGVIGEFKLVEQSDTHWYYTVDIGSDSPVECYAFTEYDGPSNSLNGLVEHGLKGAQALNDKTLSGKYTLAIDSGVISGSPYLMLDTLYTLGEGDQKVSGVMKGMSALTSQSLQICLHNEIGYRKTFHTVFESFLNAFISSEPDTEFFESVFQLSFNNIPVGYIQERFSADAEGDINVINNTAMLVPVDASSLARTDSVSNAWSSPDGSLINGTEYSVENGALKSSFSIGVKDDKWLVEGELQGKPVTSTLEYDGWLLSGFGSYVETKKLMKSEQESGDFRMWTAGADPTTALNVKVSKVADNPDANFKVDLGSIVMTYQVNDKGIIEKGAMAQGAISMDLKQLHVRGEPILK